MILYRPLKWERTKDRRLTQAYWSNFQVNGKWMYGDIVKWWNKHEGIDYAWPQPWMKIPCYSSVEGLVSKAWYDKWRGNHVYVQFYGYEIIYAHLDSITCKLWPINALEQIGVIGTTWNSTWVHLHYWLRPIWWEWIDPTPYITDWDNNETIDPEYQEAIDLGITNWDRPNDIATREEVAIMALRAFKLSNT